MANVPAKGRDDGIPAADVAAIAGCDRAGYLHLLAAPAVAVLNSSLQVAAQAFRTGRDVGVHNNESAEALSSFVAMRDIELVVQELQEPYQSLALRVLTHLRPGAFELSQPGVGLPVPTRLLASQLDAELVRRHARIEHWWARKRALVAWLERWAMQRSRAMQVLAFRSWRAFAAAAKWRILR